MLFIIIGRMPEFFLLIWLKYGLLLVLLLHLEDV